jgi:hypothetical protein
MAEDGPMTKHAMALILVAACGKSGGGHQADAPPNVPAMITISGTATQQAMTGSGTPAQGVTVAAFRNSDENTPVAMTTTDASGNYTLTITTNGQPLDGFLKATKMGNADTYLYPPAPLVADFAMASINELDTTLYGLVAQLIGRGQPGQGMIALECVDTMNHTVAGAMVTSMPAAAHTGYSGSGSPPLPNIMATQTLADGRAFLFGLTPGMVMVSATATGATFKSHSLNVHADAFTTTIITE